MVECDFTECADPIKTIFTTNLQVLHDELKSIYDEENRDTCDCTDEQHKKFKEATNK